MLITIKLTSNQLRQVHNLVLNCTDKQDMFDHLVNVGVNAYNAIIMSNSFKSLNKISYTVLSISDKIPHRTKNYV